MKRKNIAVCIILSIVTFGIYGIVWFVQMHNNVMELANPPKKTSGGMAFFLTLITCGIYGWYWGYNTGKLLDDIYVKNGKPAQNRSVLYLVLNLLELAIVTYALVQSSINDLLPEDPKPAA